MVQKATAYERVKLDAQAYEDIFAAWAEVARGTKNENAKPNDLRVHSGPTAWTFDDWHEFLGAVRERHTHSSATFGPVVGQPRVYLSRPAPGRLYATISAASRGEAERISAAVDRAVARLQEPEQIVPPATVRPRIFIGHGRSHAWRDLKDHLADMHGYEIEAYESGARAGHTIRDVLEQMLNESTFAILVMTAEDEQAAGLDSTAPVRARQNVVHEAGLFQGRLGFARAIILLEEGTEPFSNVDGVQYVSFGPGRIRESFGDVLATLRREFPQT